MTDTLHVHPSSGQVEHDTLNQCVHLRMRSRGAASAEGRVHGMTDRASRSHLAACMRARLDIPLASVDIRQIGHQGQTTFPQVRGYVCISAGQRGGGYAPYVRFEGDRGGEPPVVRRVQRVTLGP